MKLSSDYPVGGCHLFPARTRRRWFLRSSLAPKTDAPSPPGEERVLWGSGFSRCLPAWLSRTAGGRREGCAAADRIPRARGTGAGITGVLVGTGRWYPDFHPCTGVLPHGGRGEGARDVHTLRGWAVTHFFLPLSFSYFGPNPELTTAPLAHTGLLRGAEEGVCETASLNI